MTLIASSLSDRWILQVSDRRITDDQQKVWDPSSNKTVIFLANDGVAVLGYSGRAFIDGITTDTWIARQLGGEVFEPDVDPRDVHAAYVERIGPPLQFRLGDSLRRLSLAHATSWAGLARGADRSQPVTISVVGWRMGRGNIAHPFYCSIREGRGLSALPVYEPHTRGAPARTHFQPHLDPRIRAEFDATSGRGNSSDVNFMALLSHKAIFDSSQLSSLVGPDVLIVVIPHPELGKRLGIFGYHADPTFVARSSTEIDPRSLSRSPWIVSPYGYSPPCENEGSLEAQFNVGSWRFQFKRPSVPDARSFDAPAGVVRPMARRQQIPMPPETSQAPPQTID